MDLLDWKRGKLSLRLLTSLFLWLVHNPASGLSRAIRGHSWTVDTYLLAQIADASTTSAAGSYASAGIDMHDFELLRTIIRPEDDEPSVEFSKPEDIAEFQQHIRGIIHGR